MSHEPEAGSDGGAEARGARDLAAGERRVGAARGVILGAGMMGVVDALALVVLPRILNKGLVPVATHVIYALGHAFAIGLGMAATTALYLRARTRIAPAGDSTRAERRRRRTDVAAIAVGSLLFGALLLRDDLGHLAGRLGRGRAWLAELYLVALVVLVALGVPAAAAAARFAARGGARWAVLAAGLALAVVNHLVLTTDYPGAHLYLFVTGVVVAGVALASVRVPAVAEQLPAAIAGGCLAVLAAWAGWSILAVPTSRHRVEMLAVNGTNLEPFLARIQAHATSFARRSEVPAPERPWFVDRREAPPVPPTDASDGKPTDDIVVFLTLDSLRANVVESGQYDERLPELTKMRREGLHFTMARSPGSETIYSLSEIFAAKYFSQVYWASYLTDVWPAKDTSIRFPTLLADAGVATVTYASQEYLVDELGVVRGFTEEKNFELEGTQRVTPPLAPELGDAIVERLGRQGAGPLFLFVHFMDSHAPYYAPSGGETTRIDAFDGGKSRFIRAVAQIDAQIGRIRAVLTEKGLARRTTLIVSADHGEAFGEHGATMHGTNLYEELIRVPLLVVGPRVVARAEPTPVTLVDIGATILDLYGLPTPGSYMGQSLVPLFRGEKAELTRPIVAEGRLKQAMILSSGLKLIRNQREGTHEIYDLTKDPHEKKDLFEAMGAAGRERMGILETFFDAHLLRTPRGYKPPYRR